MSSSYFENSQKNVLYDNAFITATNYYAHGGGRSRSEKESFDLLCNNIADEAIHNSDERCDAPKVHPETRKAVQEEILGWISHGDDDAEPKKILWVSGPAGAGKTAIAGAIAEICEEQGLLAGSFFFSSFSGSEKRRLKRYVVATLAYSLLQHDGLQPLRGYILSIIERDPTIFQKRLRDQCRALLLKPFYDALGKLDLSVLPKVIIFDGLDEVEAAGSRQRGKHEARMANEADQLEILAVLLQATHDVHFPFRIIVVSRPERVISDFFTTQANHVSRELFLDEKYDPNSDITLFLNASFADIRRRYGMAPGWPEERDIRRLVDTASGQFIYAATVTRFLQSGEHPNPRALLRIVLDTASEDTSLNALAPLDALYTRILMSSPDPPLVVQWIGAINRYLSRQPARFTRQLLQDYEGQAEYLLENLTSLVRIPPAGDDEAPYGFYHKSLVDYLRSAQRCGRDLQHSFETGPDFFWDRWFDVLKTISPVVPLTGSEWPDFIDRFFGIFWCMINGTDVVQGTPESVLATCDVGGWVRTVDAAFLNAPNGASSILNHIFQYTHHNCLRDDERCLRVCRHWRSNIIGECKRLGWDVPTPPVLLCELVWWKCRGSDDDWDLEAHFKPSINRSQSSLPPFRDAQEELVRQKAYRDDYEAQHAIMQSIYEALPTDWLHEVEKMVSYDTSMGTAFRKQLRRIEPAVRVQMRGLDAWLHDWLEHDEWEENGSEEEEEEEAGEVEGSNRIQDGVGERSTSTQAHLARHDLLNGSLEARAAEGLTFTFQGNANFQSATGTVFPQPYTMGPSSFGTNYAGGANTNTDILPFTVPYPGPQNLLHPSFPPPSFPEFHYDYITPSYRGAIQPYTNPDALATGPINAHPPRPPLPPFAPTYPSFPQPESQYGNWPQGEASSQAGTGSGDEDRSWVEWMTFPFHLY